MPLLIAALLGLATLLLVIYPLLAPAVPEDAADFRAPEAAEQEQGAKQALRDVDFDYRLGNLELSDYEALRERYEGRALAAMKARYDRERTLDAIIERQLADVRDELSRPTNGRKPAKSAMPNASKAGASPARATTSVPDDVRKPAKSAMPNASPSGGGSATPAPAAPDSRKPAKSAIPSASSTDGLRKSAKSATGQERRDGGVRLRRRRGA